jgi:AraC-like DNA-binding protein
MSQKDEQREQTRLRENREELLELAERISAEDGAIELFPGFFRARASKRTQSMHSIYQPAFCFIAQGSKRALLGDEVFSYDPGSYLLYTVDLPLVFHVDDATPEKPYYGFRLNLDPTLVAEVLMESGVTPKKRKAPVKAIDVSRIDADLLDALLRLVRLYEKPNQTRMLAPLIIKEIIYLLLIGGQGARLIHLVAATGETRRISEAIGYLRDRLTEPLKIEEIARRFGMSTSGFHAQFKSVTAMSPLQFQKQVRLQEARRLMFGDNLDAASAGFRVGYEDPAYFSRDYKNLFGAPPQRDIARMRSSLEA